MIAKFRVIDSSKTHYGAANGQPERDVFNLHCLDLDVKAPMRQMPKYRLQEGDEQMKYSGGQLNGKDIVVAVREMSGKGNPIIIGEILEVSK